MKNKISFFLVFALLLSAISFGSFSAAAAGEDFEIKILDSTTAEITSCKGSDSSIEIPVAEFVFRHHSSKKFPARNGQGIFVISEEITIIIYSSESCFAFSITF